MADEDDIAQITSLDLPDDVLDMGLLPGWLALPFGEAGQRQGMRAVAGGTQLRHHVIPRPRSEPSTCHEYEFRHGANVVERSDIPV